MKRAEKPVTLENKSGKLMFWMPVAISFLAMFVSGYTLWTTKLAPFKLKVISTGRLVLTGNPNSPGATEPAIGVQLLFSNNGANQGYVDDIAVVLRKSGSDARAVLFRSVFEQIEDTLNFTNELPPPKMVTFKAFPVKPGETVAKEVMFVPFSPQPEWKYELAKYSVVPYTLEAGKPWKVWEAMDVEVKQEDLRSLNQTVATPSDGGKQFVKWALTSLPTTSRERSLKDLESEIEK